MAINTKPTTFTKLWAAGGDKASPLDNKIALGWQVEIPPRQWFNWWMNRADAMLAHINQFGIPVWADGTGTEYIANRSYVQGPTDGKVYRCTTTHTTDQNPEDVGSTYWEEPFAAAGSGFSESAADAKYMAKAQNGNDIPSKGDFRTAISVYSKTEVDAIVPKGFIAFNGVTGAVLSSKNLVVVRNGAGDYTVTIDPSVRKFDNNYTVIIGAIDTGVTSQASSLADGAFNSVKASLGTRTTSTFKVNCVQRTSTLTYAGGNDANNAQALQIALGDSAYISLAYFW